MKTNIKQLRCFFKYSCLLIFTGILVPVFIKRLVDYFLVSKQEFNLRMYRYFHPPIEFIFLLIGFSIFCTLLLFAGNEKWLDKRSNDISRDILKSKGLL